ncbi:ABC transporter substrate-binding protein [Plebeiibacterium sediminum]|uniref:ABC transporter substrate-binding protein n=1 Tax=Plebeiibacterium sediminum TaxID=2992112 RepID=A0AAE3M2C2_9BACT|nr:ABC transporter substrate-binding protein [Plebeiobacterium sediminum]MCW3785996.1 ABC transporter substrate-binding protein [Plebeiobacterium sediminum]
MKRAIKNSSLIIMMLTLFLSACNQNGNQKKSAIHFVDSNGTQLDLDTIPQRIISCSPAITEVMFALHDDHRLVGRTDYCNYPPEVVNISSIGGLRNPSLEKMLSLKPDLILASTHFKNETAKQIDQLGMPFAWLMDQKSIEGAGSLILNIGKLIGSEEKADSLWKFIQADMKHTVDLIPKSVKKPTVYYVVGFGKGGDHTAGGNTFISELINKAGGINIAQDVKGWNYNLETLMQKDPDIIILPPTLKESFCQHEHYKELKAVKNKHVYAVNHHMVQLNGPRIHLALRMFAEIFYPDVEF